MQSEEIYDYILAHIDEEPEYLKQISRKAHVQLLYARMISGHLQGRVLYMLTRLIQPKNILEIGTFAGYSTLCLAEGLDEGEVDTIEINDELEDFIREAFQMSEHSQKVTLHIGDALEIIPKLNKSFDLVLMDANKRHYAAYYDLVIDQMPSGGVILADNVLWDGKVLTEPIAKDQQTKAIKAFNDKIAADNRVEKVILPLRDGLTIIRKK